MSDKRSPLFLARGSYRQRRLADAARMLPVLGAVLLMLPLLWPRSGDEVPTTSAAMLYVFGCWMLLVVAALALAHWLDPAVTETDGDDDPARGG